MDDRTMLELAAKAAGIDAEWQEWVTSRIAEFGTIKHTKREGLRRGGAPWNPLADDGDALRLARALHINIEFLRGLTTKQVVEIAASPSGRGDCLCIEPIGDAPNKAARRAITRAAAAIQLAKESK